ncbi:MAG: hypothetical protein IKW99_01210 [Bacteroidales bacterium]|nr:hypothetical protein [Bacteroidales bacterium]
MKKILFSAICLLISLGTAFAQQQQMSPEEKAKKLDEFIQQQVDKFEKTLELEDWQTFYADSILNHDYRALQAELDGLQDAKVANNDLYVQVSDKWAEQMYNSFRKILDDDQWNRYLKQGAARDKKARDKRKAKIDEANAKLQ